MAIAALAERGPFETPGLGLVAAVLQSQAWSTCGQEGTSAGKTKTLISQVRKLRPGRLRESPRTQSEALLLCSLFAPSREGNGLDFGCTPHSGGKWATMLEHFKMCKTHSQITSCWTLTPAPEHTREPREVLWLSCSHTAGE